MHLTAVLFSKLITQKFCTSKVQRQIFEFKKKWYSNNVLLYKLGTINTYSYILLWELNVVNSVIFIIVFKNNRLLSKNYFS